MNIWVQYTRQEIGDELTKMCQDGLIFFPENTGRINGGISLTTEGKNIIFLIKIFALMNYRLETADFTFAPCG